MGQFEPRDSRVVTQNPSSTPIEPERTGPRESTTRENAPGKAAQDTMEGERQNLIDENERWQVTDENRRFEDESEEGDETP